MARHKSFRRLAGKDAGGEEGVNLVPIMNLFVALIPFLLMSAAFFNISVINASVPALQDKESDLAKTSDAVTLLVQIRPDGYRISATSDTLGAAELADLRTEILRKGREMDNRSFGAHLLFCKHRYPTSDTVILVPAPSILYQEIIHTMDAARWWEGQERDGKPTRTEMFPNVVISGML